MSAILLQTTQTITGAAVEILIMLIVAAAIGAVTVYLYLKSVHKKELTEKDSILAEKEAELNQLTATSQDLQKEIEALNADIRGKDNELVALERNYDVLKSENNLKKEEVAKLKGMYDAVVVEIDGLKAQLKETNQELQETEEVIERISKRKYMLNYDSFGEADSKEKDDLMMISGIGPFIAQRLHALDIFTFRQISNFTKQDIEAVNEAIEYFPGRIERDEWVSQAKELVYSNGKKTELLEKISARKDLVNYDRIGIAHKEEANDLTIISGIGGWIQKKLNALDIYTFRQIANFTKEDEQNITQAISYFPGRIDRDEWVPQAKELVYSGGKRTALFERLKRRKHKIDYSKIGLAHRDEADDLTKISGIGGFIQEKLNILDIYTYAQISKFTEKDIETVTEIIEYFPGRIVRDNWVGQAKTLLQQGKLDLKFE